MSYMMGKLGEIKGLIQYGGDIMHIKLHPNAKENFDNKVNEVLSRIVKIERGKPKDKHDIKSKFYATQTITSEDIIGDITINLVDGLGNEKGKIFHHNGSEYGIVNDEFKNFLKISKNIQGVKELSDIVSVEFVREKLFVWLKDSFINGKTNSFIEHFVDSIEKEVNNYEIWIPVPFTSIQKSFSLGKIKFKTITETKIEEWVNILENYNINKDDLHRIKEYKEKIKKEYQNYAAGVFECKAEPIRAHELAYYHMNNSLSILRLYSKANLMPELICGAYEYGQKMRRSKFYFVTNNDIKYFSQSSSVFDKSLHWNLDNYIIDMMDKGELKYYNKLLNIERQNEFQSKLLEAIIIYSKHTLKYELYDKILYILVALETILLKNTSEAIQQNVGDRMAFTIGKNAEERREISKTLKDIYKIRSKFIHHGQFSYENLDLIKKFMYYAWITFSTIVKNIYNFKTKEGFVDTLENIKYS